MNSRWLIIIGGLLAAVAGVFAFMNMPQEQPEALVYQPPRALAPFELESTAATTKIDSEALKGQWTLLFTGYTYCPDICPTTLSSLKTILPQLQKQAEKPVKVWMISVDPQRDSLDRLKEYTGYFGEQFIGVRAEHPQLFPFVRDLGLMYSVPEEGEENYLVNHSAAIILVNPDGKRLAIFNATHEPGAIPTVDMEQLVRDFAILAG
ncbi:SCO family protein [Idiomarina sp. UBA3162]|jgi:protein SCO1/2|uniref:SCO family protein n=1 Tax=unclassified Idiomarina TaxID=2614829 RepID=UPI000C96373C|nr:SCO family protein [Idiomarina sp. UBA3162]MAD53526.1 SCO family protein [Idiomarinaceae bacterium]MEC7642464.1 SCO family protein [Pseudomonadota bacterium]MEC9318925.1 SCO family protein [Pseudomonadota bacterium]|tara:strand:- start:369 stop:989 length:621 start_codon:yes stop_codon:yes gene_type:complete